MKKLIELKNQKIFARSVKTESLDLQGCKNFDVEFKIKYEAAPSGDLHLAVWATGGTVTDSQKPDYFISKLFYNPDGDHDYTYRISVRDCPYDVILIHFYQYHADGSGYFELNVLEVG